MTDPRTNDPALGQDVPPVDTSVYVASLGRSPAAAPVRRDRLTRVLVVLLIFFLGFLAGSRLQSVAVDLLTPPPPEEDAPPRSSDGPGSETAGVPADGVVAATVKVVEGSTLFVVDAGGQTLKVTTGSASVVTAARSIPLGDLRPGDRVTVSGERQPDGSLAAATVSGQTSR